MNKNILLLILYLASYSSLSIAAPFAYVVNGFDVPFGTITIIDIATNTPTTNFSEGSAQPLIITFTRDGSRAYVTNPHLFFGPLGNTITPIDIPSNTVLPPVTVGTAPLVVTTPRSCGGTMAYVTNSQSMSISVLDIRTNTVTSTIFVPDTPTFGALTADDSLLYVTLNTLNEVIRIDTHTNTIVGSPINVGGGPRYILITPDEKNAYVANESGSVSHIDLTTNTVVATIPLPGTTPTSLAITPDGRFLYVTNQQVAGSVIVIDTLTDTVFTTISGINFATIVVMSPTGKTAYVTSLMTNSVVVIDVATNTITDAIIVGTGPLGIAITPLFSATGIVQKNVFLDHTECVLTIRWTPSPSAVSSYNIYHGTTVIGTVAANKDLKFVTCLQPDDTASYSITAVAPDGSESTHILVCPTGDCVPTACACC